MQILYRPAFAIVMGVLVILGLARFIGGTSADEFSARLTAAAPEVIEQAGGGSQVHANFISPRGLPSRHPILTGGEPLDETTRAAIATAVASMPGVGGIRWSDGDIVARADDPVFRPLHCQEDVQSLLRARTIRFEESSSRMDASSTGLVDEVAAALRPCLGSIIQITGHTDKSGPEPDNVALSAERAAAVRQALITRGIPGDGLRARGVGSRSPVEGLDASDPANRRIDFSVLATEPIKPTPIDTPSPR